MDAFIKSIAWHDMVFAKTGRGDIWRIWFTRDFVGAPMMERLFGDESEWHEPIAKLKKFDIRTYLANAAEAHGLWLTEEAMRVNSDSRCFLISKSGIDGFAALSISGLEEIQNGTDAAMADLLNCRLDNALKSLEKCANDQAAGDSLRLREADPSPAEQGAPRSQETRG